MSHDSIVEDAIEFLERRLEEEQNQQKAMEMAAYMRTSMPFYGVQSPMRKQIVRELKAYLGRIEDVDLYRQLVTRIWELEAREEKYIAVSMARAYKTHIQPAQLDLYEQLIRQGQWWDFVDEIASHLIGHLVANHPDELWPIMDEWIDDDDFWIQRTAILCQLRAKQNTNSEKLFSYITKRMDEEEFFIRKAIGWALREYGKSNAEEVCTFLREHHGRLSNLSYKEGARILKTQGHVLP